MNNFLKFVVYFCGNLWFNTLMTFETGEILKHKRNPQWRCRVVRDLDPTRPVNGWLEVKLLSTGRHFKMLKSILRKWKKRVDFFRNLWFNTHTMNDTKNMTNLPATPEATWQITFDNDSTIFIAGRDEEHARRVVENNKGFSRWRRTPECEWVTRTIKKIERVTW